ncbi:hypothetical protein MXB_2932, partial [Myxobolus squamalis]
DLVNVIAEKIDGCDFCTKKCFFEILIPIKAVLTYKAKKDVKIYKAKITLTDEESKTVTTYQIILCDAVDLEKCNTMHPCFEQTSVQFTLNKRFLMVSFMEK